MVIVLIYIKIYCVYYIVFIVSLAIRDRIIVKTYNLKKHYHNLIGIFIGYTNNVFSNTNLLYLSYDYLKRISLTISKKLFLELYKRTFLRTFEISIKPHELTKCNLLMNLHNTAICDICSLFVISIWFQ